ncbi:hypothetical protein MKX03_022418 [Papaver bracteatum]|nr:hypothetical protein MKX03_022418 [Papaver bracteatum]
MDSYVFKRRADEAYMMAARVIVAIENPQDIIIQSARPYGQRAVLKFCSLHCAQPLARRHTAGTFTNQMQKSFTKPLPYVEIGIPANNKGKNSIGCLFWMLARMVLQMCGIISPGHKWDPGETKDQEADEGAAPVANFGVTEYGGAGTMMISNDQCGGDAQWVGDAIAASALAAVVDAAWEPVASPVHAVDAAVIPPAAG